MARDEGKDCKQHWIPTTCASRKIGRSAARSATSSLYPCAGAITVRSIAAAKKPPKLRPHEYAATGHANRSRRLIKCAKNSGHYRSPIRTAALGRTCLSLLRRGNCSRQPQCQHSSDPGSRTVRINQQAKDGTALCFLRQPNRPINPIPLANSGKVGERGVAELRVVTD